MIIFSCCVCVCVCVMEDDGIGGPRLRPVPSGTFVAPVRGRGPRALETGAETNGDETEPRLGETQVVSDA